MRPLRIALEELCALASVDRGARGIKSIQAGLPPRASAASADAAPLTASTPASLLAALSREPGLPVAALELGFAAAAFARASSVVVLSGFPCCLPPAASLPSLPAAPSSPAETDGPAGAAALCAAALRLGKSVTLATDEACAGVFAAAAGAAGCCGGGFAVAAFPAAAAWDAAAAARLAALIAATDHAVAIERAGAAADGSFYTMRGR